VAAGWSLPQTRADDRPPKLEPSLEENVFEHVLDVIRKQGLHIEPKTRARTRPGERAIYHAGYYGAFVLDPDGNNVELVNHNR
jgi:catechol 2,3-dioxygenase-like lactoylglutathione lyase family enzyme